MLESFFLFDLTWNDNENSLRHKLHSGFWQLQTTLKTIITTEPPENTKNLSRPSANTGLNLFNKLLFKNLTHYCHLFRIKCDSWRQTLGWFLAPGIFQRFYLKTRREFTSFRLVNLQCRCWKYTKNCYNDAEKKPWQDARLLKSLKVITHAFSKSTKLSRFCTQILINFHFG